MSEKEVNQIMIRDPEIFFSRGKYYNTTHRFDVVLSRSKDSVLYVLITRRSHDFRTAKKDGLKILGKSELLKMILTRDYQYKGYR